MQPIIVNLAYLSSNKFPYIFYRFQWNVGFQNKFIWKCHIPNFSKYDQNDICYQLNLKWHSHKPPVTYGSKANIYTTMSATIEDCNLNLSGLVNTYTYGKKIKQESRRQSHSNSLCPVFIQYRQEGHCSALTQIH